MRYGWHRYHRWLTLQAPSVWKQDLLQQKRQRKPVRHQVQLLGQNFEREYLQPGIRQIPSCKYHFLRDTAGFMSKWNEEPQGRSYWFYYAFNTCIQCSDFPKPLSSCPHPPAHLFKHRACLLVGLHSSLGPLTEKRIFVGEWRWH